MTFDAYLARVESATDDSVALGVIRAQATSDPDLDDEERSEVLGRVATYTGDLRATDEDDPDDWAGLRGEDESEDD